MKVKDRTIRLTWYEFEHMLKKSNGYVLNYEKIANITLTKPKTLLIQLERVVKKEVSDEIGG